MEGALPGAGATLTAAGARAVDLASGKGAGDENFPVASWLVRPDARAPIMAFYRFARLADDVADHESASAEAKRTRLAALRDGILGASDAEPEAAALRRAMAERGIDRAHALDLLTAFGRDVDQDRYSDWEALIGYCRVSAMPVGRFVLDVHGEDRALWRLSDALCAALQVINHLQDCGKDWRGLGRVYLPLDMMAAAGADVEMLGARVAPAPLRTVIARLAERSLSLLDEAAPFARRIRDRRLAVEVAVIHGLAADLAARLRLRDPLSERVHHTKPEALLLAGRAALGQLVRR